MSTHLLEIQPQDLKFKYELKKQSSCSVRLINNSDQNVAFKVKTTAPNKYCVRPNVGIIMPKSICDFTVIMQAQRSTPPYLICRDRFLIQSTIVTDGTTNEDITRSMFVKGEDKYIEERKLRVSLITLPHSPVLSPMNGKLKQEPAYETSLLKDQVLGRVEIVTPEQKDVESSKSSVGFELNPVKEANITSENAEFMPKKHANLRPAEDVEYAPIKNAELSPRNDAKFKSAEDEGFTPTKKEELKPREDENLITARNAQITPVKSAELVPVNDPKTLMLVKNIEELKSKVVELESKLTEAEVTISKLTEERRLSVLDNQILREELVRRSKRGVRKVQVGFPPLFVCMVALVGVMFGYFLQLCK